MFELALCSRLLEFFDSNNEVSATQHGYRKGRNEEETVV